MLCMAFLEKNMALAPPIGPSPTNRSQAPPTGPGPHQQVPGPTNRSQVPPRHLSDTTNMIQAPPTGYRPLHYIPGLTNMTQAPLTGLRPLHHVVWPHKHETGHTKRSLKSHHVPGTTNRSQAPPTGLRPWDHVPGLTSKSCASPALSWARVEMAPVVGWMRNWALVRGPFREYSKAEFWPQSGSLAYTCEGGRKRRGLQQRLFWSIIIIITVSSLITIPDQNKIDQREQKATSIL